MLVLRGCLRPTASLVAGTTWCRVRQLTPFSGSSTLAAYPGQPVEVTGWRELPSAGDQVLEANTEDEAKKAVANRLKRIEMEKMWKDVEVINEKRVTDSAIDVVRKEEEKKAKAKGLKGNAITAAGNLAVDAMEGATTGSKVKELVLIIKADVSGTVEAVVGALEGIGNKEAKVKIIFSGVGDVQESDVEMAKAVEGSSPSLRRYTNRIDENNSDSHNRWIQRQSLPLPPASCRPPTIRRPSPRLTHHLPTRRNDPTIRRRPPSQDH